MMTLFWNYFDANAKQKDAKHFGNVVHPNMFSCSNIDESTLVILLVPLPELHILLGPVNTPYDELTKEWPQAEEWSTKLNIKREEYHGGKFNGNDSRKLIKNLSVLKEIAPTPSLRISTFRQAYRKLRINVTPKVHAVFHHIPEFCDIVKMGLSP